MSDIKTRMLVIRRCGSRPVLCDEETGQPLEGQTSVVLESSNEHPPRITVTFEAWGAAGVRFEDDPRQEID
ncbi:hypothetical protein [Acinetobacter schindleri]|uniref:hypothetical protein n=1 Tax=Acinetobacter schindleri TaxID=108981 RepID=UPI002362E7E9|nr:hypothetical protein [Acinetobacter schindleri]